MYQHIVDQSATHAAQSLAHLKDTNPQFENLFLQDQIKRCQNQTIYEEKSNINYFKKDKIFGPFNLELLVLKHQNGQTNADIIISSDKRE